MSSRGLSKGEGGRGAIAPSPYFGRIEGAARQRRRASLLLAPPILESYWGPCQEHHCCFYTSKMTNFLVQIWVWLDIEHCSPFEVINIKSVSSICKYFTTVHLYKSTDKVDMATTCCYWISNQLSWGAWAQKNLPNSIQNNEAKFLQIILRSKNYPILSLGTQMEYPQQKMFGMKYCSNIWFMHTTGLFRHQLSQKNLKRTKKFWRSNKSPKPKISKFYVIFSADMDHME